MTKFKYFHVTLDPPPPWLYLIPQFETRVTCVYNPSPQKPMSKIHRKGALVLVTYHTLNCTLEKISILYSSSGVLFQFFFFLYIYSKYQIKTRGNRQKIISLLIRILNMYT